MVTMAQYNQAQREGHLATMLRIFGYLKHYKKWRLIVDVTLPKERENEELPPNMHEPKGKEVQYIYNRIL